MELVEGERSNVHPRGGGGTTDLGEVRGGERGCVQTPLTPLAVGRVDGDLPCCPTVGDLIDSIL